MFIYRNIYANIKLTPHAYSDAWCGAAGKRPLLIIGLVMITNVYVDGFNLYYCCLKGTAFKWLDIAALCKNIYPRNKINRIRYFTARIQPTPNDPHKARRQLTYIRALETINYLTVHYGTFKTRIKKRPLVNPISGLPRKVDILDTEEKGSDVNLATYLVYDGCISDYEVAIVISNDSDLVEPLNIVRERIKLPVGLLNPQINRKKVSWDLMNAATFKRYIRQGVLGSSQFPATMQDTTGTFHKPNSW